MVLTTTAWGKAATYQDKKKADHSIIAKQAFQDANDVQQITTSRVDLLPIDVVGPLDLHLQQLELLHGSNRRNLHMGVQKSKQVKQYHFVQSNIPR